MSYKQAENVDVVKVLKLDPVKIILKEVGVVMGVPVLGERTVTVGVLTATGV